MNTTTTITPPVERQADASSSDAKTLADLYRRGRETDKALSKAITAFRKAPTADRFAKVDELSLAWIQLHDDLVALPAGTTARGGITLADVYGAVFAPASKTDLRKRVDAAFGV